MAISLRSFYLNLYNIHISTIQIFTDKIRGYKQVICIPKVWLKGSPKGTPGIHY